METRRKEEELLKNVKEQKESLKKLELELNKEEKVYKEAIQESESMQSVLKDAATNTSTAVLQQLISGLGNLRDKEKEQRCKVEKLRSRVEKRKSKLVDIAVTKKLKTT